MPAFLIAYDVSDPKRLRRVARALERRAVRVRHSVFLFHGEQAALAEFVEDLRRRIRPDEDVIQAWPVPPGEAPSGTPSGPSAPSVPRLL